MEEEGEFWHKRFDESWLLKGDNNIVISTGLLMVEKGKNYTFSLKEGDGVIQGLLIYCNMPQLIIRHYLVMQKVLNAS